MAFISFLKKFGVILGKVALAEAGIVQGIKVADPALSPQVDKLDTIFQSILATEGMFANAFPAGQTGAQKLLAASTLVTPILNEVGIIKGKKIANVEQYQASVSAAIAAFVGILNSLDGSEPITTTTITAPAAAVAPGPVKV